MDEDFRLLQDYTEGFMVSQVVFAACELGVFDALAAAPEPMDAATLASALRTDPRATGLLLDTCASLRLLRAEDRAGTVVYANTRLSATYLASCGPETQCHMMAYLGGTTYRCWAHLADAVRSGRNQYRAAFGVETSDPFSAIYRSEHERRSFLRGLEDVWAACGRRLLEALPLGTCARVCDLGGGSGALARVCAALFPACRVTVFDLPEVVRDAEAAGRVDFVAGDFFRDPLPRADAYVLARVLHDWDDRACATLLRRVHGACGEGGLVAVVESLLRDDGRGPAHTLLLSLNMLLQTEGRERSLPDLRRLLAGAGFRDVRSRVAGDAYDVVWARK